MTDELIREAKEKLVVSFQAAKDYREKKYFMLNFLNEKMSKRPDILSLIGNNPLQMMYDNHEIHVNLMANVFEYSLFEILVKTVPWVYRAYHNNGFSYDYFLEELRVWMEAVEKFLPSSSADEINKTYIWLIENHEKMIELSQKQDEFKIFLEEEWRPQKNKFLSYLLRADLESALKFANKFIKSSKSIEDFYLKIIQPALYEIGNLWEKGKISVAEEHIASSIVARVLAHIYIHFLKIDIKSKFKAIVTASPNEYHELGARMLADLLQMDGWKVYYLGANVPEGEVIKLIKKVKPNLICISITMPFNFDKAKSLINRIRTLKEDQIKVMVGGLLLKLFPEIYKNLEANFGASDAKEAVNIAKSLKDHL